MPKKYLIRQSHYAYDDESFYPCAKSMHSIYSTKQEANEAAKELNSWNEISMPSDFGKRKAYVVMEIDEDPVFYVVWNSTRKRPVLRDADDCGKYLVYGFTEEEEQAGHPR